MQKSSKIRKITLTGCCQRWYLVYKVHQVSLNETKESASRVPLAAGLDRAMQLAAMAPRYTVGIKGPAEGFFHQKHLQGLFVSFAVPLSILKSRIERKMNECPDPNGILHL